MSAFVGKQLTAGVVRVAKQTEAFINHVLDEAGVPDYRVDRRAASIVGMAKARFAKKRKFNKITKVRTMVISGSNYGGDIHYLQGVISFIHTAALSELTSDDCVLVTQGTQQIQRNGRKIWLKKVSFNLALQTQPHSGTSTGDDHVAYRLMLVQDKRANGSGTSMTQVVSSANTLTFRNRDNLDRFVVIYDKLHIINIPLVVDFDATTYTRPPVERLMPIRKVWPGKGLMIEYNEGNTTGVTSARARNNLTLIGFQAHASPKATLSGNVETLFFG